MDWGIKNRLSRIIKPKTGKTVMLAIDHGYFLGPTSGLEKPAKTVEPLLPYADSLMLTRGILRNCIDAAKDIPVVLRVSGGNSIVGEDISKEGLTASVEDAMRLNAAAVTMSIYIGSKYEHQTLINLGRLVDTAQRYGMPVLAVTAVGKEMTRDARYLGLCCRIASEIGAHFVKTYYCKDFEKVVEGTPIPVVVAGGKKIAERDALKLARNSVKDGAIGVDMGRNIFQSDSPVGMIKAVKAIVHDSVSADKAFGIYQDEKKKPGKKKK